MHELLVGSTLLAAFLGGVVALLAPCCVSVMLPAYFATTFRRRSNIVAMTLVFAAGVGTVILPIGLGATVLSRLVSGNHWLVFSTGGAAMTLAGVAILFGWKPRIPMPGGGPRSGNGVGSVYALGVFSGAASSCCAPVLAGVVLLSGATASFPAALATGVAYVFGMVAPLSALALLWDRKDWGSSRLLTGRTVTIRIGRWAHRMTLSNFASGVLLAGMGILSIILAFTGPSMPTSGWRVTLSARLEHYASVTTSHLAWLPGWVDFLLIFGVLAGLVWFAVHRRRAEPATAAPPVATADSLAGTQQALLATTSSKDSES